MINEIENILRGAGTILLDLKTKNGRDGSWTGSQFHAVADEKVNTFICNELEKLGNNYLIVSEENQNSIPKDYNGKFWLIDPLDGTASYAEGFNGYVTQIALMEKLEPILSGVYAPETNEFYFAKKNNGAYLNGTKLLNEFENSLTLIDNYNEPRGIAKIIYEKFNVNKYIECGSIGLKICKLAQGKANIFIKDVKVRDWDLAAPQLILLEANGFICDINFKKILYKGRSIQNGIVATNHKKIFESIKMKFKTDLENL